MFDRLAELEANHAEYERILGRRTYQEVADELAALRAPDEIAWLIEFSGHPTPTYYGKADDGLGQTADHLSAIRFCRPQDAQAVIDDIGWTEATPVEHMWCSTKSTVQSSSVTDEMVEAAYGAFTRSFASKPIGGNNTRDDLRAALAAAARFSA